MSKTVLAGTGDQVLDAVRPCSTLVDAVRKAVQDVIPAAGPLTDEQVSYELEKRIQEYWGADHGISQAELRATARDVMKIAPKR